METMELVPLVLKFATRFDGLRACPPEDCGGTRGFEGFVKAVTDPTHEKHVEYVQWGRTEGIPRRSPWPRPTPPSGECIDQSFLASFPASPWSSAAGSSRCRSR